MEKIKRFFVMLSIVTLASQFLVVQSTSAYGVGDVVINEVSWSGSLDNSADEWIELYNGSNQDIDLSAWYIEDDLASIYTIESGVIPAHGYFLIEDSEAAVNNVTADAIIGLSFANAGDSLVLKDFDDQMIDVVNGSGAAWYAGDSTSADGYLH